MKELLREYHTAMSHYMYYSMKVTRSQMLTQDDRSYLLERMRDWESALDAVQAKIKLLKENAEDKL